MKHFSKVVIIGATSAIAEQCARLLLDEIHELVLVGRSQQRLDSLACDLQVRQPRVTIRLVETGFLEPADIETCIATCWGDTPADLVLIAHGLLPEQQRCQQELAYCQETLRVNALSPVLFAEGFAVRLEAAGKGTLALIGSVAGDRGRQSNYVYGAAKGLLARYAEGLQHRFAGTPVRIVLVKPGPTDTPMTTGLQQAGIKLAPASVVANQLLRGVRRGQRTVYTPGKWRFIMLVIRHLPGFVFDRMRI